MSARKSKSDINWPRRLNRLLIGVGVVAFGLIIGDRLMSIFKSEQATMIPETTSIDRASSGSAEVASGLEAPPANDSGTLIERDATADRDNEFGSQLIFVSLSEPKYIVTADRQRYYVGSSIDEDTVLADVTDNQVIIDRKGELTAVDLHSSQDQ
ncbi:MAG: hypothetical protein AB8B63_02150 [Granulosicoccus sp.]